MKLRTRAVWVSVCVALSFAPVVWVSWRQLRERILAVDKTGHRAA